MLHETEDGISAFCADRGGIEKVPLNFSLVFFVLPHDGINHPEKQDSKVKCSYRGGPIDVVEVKRKGVGRAANNCLNHIRYNGLPYLVL